MGQITSSIGLVSGIDTASIIDQLVAIESRPVQLVQQRTSVLQSQQAAFTNVNAQLLSILSAANNLTTESSFRSTTAGSSNEEVLTASSSSGATPGSYSFLVSRLVSSQQTITRGFGDLNSTPLAGGALTFERGEARLDRDTTLDTLNGGDGVRRGYIRVTDRFGSTALVDLTRAVTVNDVIDQINNSTGVRVLASVDGDALKLTDLTGDTTSDLIVANVGTTATASSLGLAGNSGGTDELDGTSINTLGRGSVLATLNDGNGIQKHGSLNDFRITTNGGGSYDISLANTVTLGEVIDEIEEESGGDVTAAISADGLGLVLTDNTGGGAAFTVTALNSSGAASDLGILGDDTDGDTEIGGTRLTGGINSKLLRNLNGGTGVTTLGTVSIEDRSGVVTAIDLSAANSVAEVVSLINDSGSNVTASLNDAGNGLLLTDNSGGAGDIVISDTSGTTATDLGFAGTFSDTDTVDSGNLQFQYITGSTLLETLGVSSGKFIITDSKGLSATVDLTQGDERTVGDVLREINSRGLAITARINDTGDGILLEDTNADPPINAIKVEESGSTTAADLGLLGEAASAGDDLDGSFETNVTITANVLETTTLLSTLNSGEGINNVTGAADFTINTSDGSSYDIDLDGVTTVAELITAVDTATGGAVTVDINSIETGLKLTDNTAGASTFSIEAFGESTAASDLGIEKTDTNDDGVISGGTLVEITTLQDLADAINDANAGVVASIINDGSPGNPYRLSLSASEAGSNGAFVFDDGGLGFSPVTLAEAQDAVVFFGGSDPSKAIALTSSTNTLDDVIPGVDITLKSASTSPVTVTVNKDTAAVTQTVQGFVDSVNTLMNNIHQLDSYDAETEQRGLLLGDSTLSKIESTIFNAVISRNTDLTGAFTSLSQIGIKVGSGAVLEFDSSKFQAALESDPEAVEALFTFEETEEDDDGETVVTASGIGPQLVALLERLTDAESGAVQTRINSIERQVKQNTDRVEFLNDLIEQKRARLEAQFVAMELALAKMQDQGSALNALSALASKSSASVTAG